MPETPEVTAPGNANAEEPKKWVIDYQATDENGNPIGNPTHLEADTQQLLIEKMRDTNIEIVRAYHKLKTGATKPDLSKAQKRRAPSEAKPKEWSAEETFQTFQEAQNPANFRKAIRKTIEDELGIPLDDLRTIPGGVAQVNRGLVEQNFLARHREDYYPCKQNEKAILDYLSENNLAFNLDNLETAFDYLKDSLIHAPRQAAAQTPNEEETQAAVNTEAQRKRTVTTGIVPGEASGTRPAKTGTSQGLSWAVIDSWSDEEWEKQKRNPNTVAWMNAHPRGRTK